MLPWYQREYQQTRWIIAGKDDETYHANRYHLPADWLSKGLHSLCGVDFPEEKFESAIYLGDEYEMGGLDWDTWCPICRERYRGLMSEFLSIYSKFERRT